MFFHVISTQYISEYKVQISFNNGQVRVADLSYVATIGCYFQTTYDLNRFSLG